MRRLICFSTLFCLLAACKPGSPKILPIYGNRQAVIKTVNGQPVTDTVYQTIPPFKFINQYGDSISSKALDGHIYVADFFFTTCPSICPVMQRNMLNVYHSFKNDNDVKIISYTIDPKHDSVPVLKRYAGKLGISGNTWWFLRGDKDLVYNLAAKSYLVGVNRDTTAAGGFIHQGYFVLIDKQSRIRGSYDGTDMAQVSQLIADMKTLKAEPVAQ